MHRKTSATLCLLRVVCAFRSPWQSASAGSAREAKGTNLPHAIGTTHPETGLQLPRRALRPTSDDARIAGGATRCSSGPAVHLSAGHVQGTSDGAGNWIYLGDEEEEW